MTQPPREPIRDHGKVVTAPAGTPQEAVVDALTGADKLPPIGQELGRPPAAPPFDPHAGHEVPPGREFGGEGEPMISTLVFMGIDQGGDFEDAIHQVVTAAENLGLYFVTATVGHLNIEQHGDNIQDIWNAITPDEADDGEPEDKPDADEDLGEPI